MALLPTDPKSKQEHIDAIIHSYKKYIYMIRKKKIKELLDDINQNL